MTNTTQSEAVNALIELLMERDDLANVDTWYVILRNADGGFRTHRTEGLRTADLLGMLRCAQLSEEKEMLDRWKQPHTVESTKARVM